MPFGLLTTGFAPMSLSDVQDDLEAAWRAEFGANADLAADSPDGQVVGIMSERFALLWELAQAVYDAYAPDLAEGAALDEVCAITGTTRRPATFSTVTLTATGTNGTVLSTGREASVVDTGAHFVTLAPATLLTTTAWSGAVPVSVGDRRTNGGNVYQCTSAGVTAAAGGPTGNGQDILDGTARWRFLGQGTADVDVAAQAAETGPTLGLSNTITVIETPVSGWTGVTNVLDAETGTDVETDAALRIRRAIELGSEGASTLNAIRAAILRVTGVTECVVFQNQTNSDSTDTPPLPPKSFEAIVRGGADQDIWDAIFANQPVGIQAFGAEEGSSIDDRGDGQPVAFSRPNEKDIYVTVDLVADRHVFPEDGAAQVEQAIVDAGDAYRFGQDVHASAVSAQAFQIAGVLNVTSVKLGLAPSPGSSASISCEPRDVAVFDTSRTIINVSYGVP